MSISPQNNPNNQIEIANFEIKHSSPNKLVEMKSSAGLTNILSDVNSNNPSITKKMRDAALAGSNTGGEQAGVDNAIQNSQRKLDENEVDLAVLEKPEYDKERVIYITRNKRIAIFFLIISINIVANFDDGTIPAATEEIRLKLNVKDEDVGLLGTLVYVGNLIGI